MEQDSSTTALLGLPPGARARIVGLAYRSLPTAGGAAGGTAGPAHGPLPRGFVGPAAEIRP